MKTWIYLTSSNRRAALASNGRTRRAGEPRQRAVRGLMVRLFVVAGDHDEAAALPVRILLASDGLWTCSRGPAE
jgi:hypothetical protein